MFGMAAVQAYYDDQIARCESMVVGADAAERDWLQARIDRYKLLRAKLNAFARMTT